MNDPDELKQVICAIQTQSPPIVPFFEMKENRCRIATC
jgi:hypothetical protein